VTQLTSCFNPSPTAGPRTRGSVRRDSGFVQIVIALRETDFGEQTEQACAKAWLHQLTLRSGQMTKRGAIRQRRLLLLVVLTIVLQLNAAAQCDFVRPSRNPVLKNTFEPTLNDGKLTIHIRLDFAGGRNGTAELDLPSDWAGQSHLETGIRNLKALSAHTVLLDTPPSNLKTLRFSMGSYVAVSYDLLKDWNGPLEYPKQFRPVLERDFFEFNTQNALVRPKFGPSDIVTVFLDWRNLPISWKLATSFGTNAHCQAFTGPWHKMMNALFAGGDFRIHSAGTAGQQLVLAIQGNWPFSDEEALDKIQKIIWAERKFWQDEDFPYYLITLKAFEGDNGGSNGSAFTNAFWLYLSRDSTFSYGIQKLLAHESFHAWSPYKMGPIPEPSVGVHWFTEGFTVYYSDLLLLRVGSLSLAEYLDRVNRNLADYELSPEKSLSNDEIVVRYQHENSIDQLTYIRGGCHRVVAR
jgi:predicted metalloprotease with PDZ domain